MRVSLFSISMVAAVAELASATNLFVSDYGGSITSFSLSAKNGSWSLTQTHETKECAPNPSWLTIDSNRGLLFCLNEGLETPNGSLSSFTINRDGSLHHVQNTTTISGPVSGVIYGSPAGRRAIALAHYTGSAVSTWFLNGGGRFASNEAFHYTLQQPGVVPDRQDAPHEHEAVIDPTGQYIVVPDLGADLVRVFGIDDATLKLQPLEALHAKPGTGPRHVAFWNPYGVAGQGSTTYMYLVGELASSVTGYAVEYLPNSGGLKFTQVFNSSTFGGLLNLPEGTAPAEIQISPDNRFLIISNRYDLSFTLPQPNGTKIPSDSLSTFALHDDGSLTFVQLWPAGGRVPRHFSLNAIGNLVGVGLQFDQTVAILQRDVATGLIGEPVARAKVPGNVTCVVFDEDRALGRFG